METPLYKAAEAGHDQIVKILLGAGAAVKAKDYYNKTALHKAAAVGHDQIVKVLLEAGAEVNSEDRHGRTPLYMAAIKGRSRTVQLLIGKGADINAKGGYKGETSLHQAVLYNRKGTVQILVEAGAEIHTKNDEGKTPLDYAGEEMKGSLKEIAIQRHKIKAAFPGIADKKEFKLLLSKGFYFSYNNRVYLAGACNVGKSTLASILIGEVISKDWISTDGLRIYFGKNGIHLKKKEMIVLSKALKDGNILSNVLLGQPSMAKTPYVRSKGVLKALKGLFKASPHNRGIPVSTKTSSHGVPPSRIPFLSPVVPDQNPGNAMQQFLVMEHEKSKDDLKRKQHSSISSKRSHVDIQHSLTEEIKSGKYKVQIAPSDLVDFGGQKAFDLTHQLFILQNGAFVLLVDGRKNLDDVLSEYLDGKMTTRIHDDDIYPLVVFAVTHRDELTKEEQHKKLKEVTKELADMFSNHEFCDRIKFKQVFFINGTDRNDSGVKSLKEYLVHVAFKQKSWGEKMPMAWVPLELQIAEMRSNDILVISFDEIYDINMNNDDLALPDEQLKHFLRCQHSLGKLMFFDVHGLDKFVIVQPTAMVDILRSFVTDEMFWPRDPSLYSILSTITKSGLIKTYDLFQLWMQDEFNKYVPTLELKEFIARILVHLDILIEPKHFRKNDQELADSFIVPCMIKKTFSYLSFPLSLNNDKTIFLSYKFLRSAIPNALVYKLIGAVLNIWPLKRIGEMFCFFDKAAVLDIDQNNDLYLTFKDNRVIVALSNSASKYYISPDIASVIQECLTLTLPKVIDFYSSSFGKSNSSADITDLFDTEVGEMCGNEICFTSLSSIKGKSTWTCIQKIEHETRFPLYWIFDQKQTMCSTDCEGLDMKGLDMIPEDKHLIRLARQIGRKFYEFIIHLGLSVVEWEDIEDNRVYADKLTKKFVALCTWKKNIQARDITPTFRYLSKALTRIDFSKHFLCQVFREKFTEVFALDNQRLQEIPDDSVLEKLSRKHIGYHTLQLGIELELYMNSIEETMVRYPKDMFAQTYDILVKWKTTCKVKPTVRTLMVALQYVDSRGFKFLKEQYAEHRE